MVIITDERCTGYSAAGHPERPARVAGSVELLRSQQELKIDWRAPSEAPDASILRAHTPEHLAHVKSPQGDFDGDTPAYPEIFQHARRSAGGALDAMNLAREGQTVFSLLRPPGHHATKSQAMGFCFFNSIAIAVLEGQAASARRVAVFDFDVHHGNGTEDILLDRPNTLFTSIHQHPCYPGTGTVNRGSNCFNFPVAPRTPREEYRKVFEKAFAEVKRFKPDLIGISAGFDAYARDPLAQETLEAEDYHWLGQTIRSLAIPVFSVLEGGYSSQLPNLILSYLKGLEGK